MIVPYHVDGSDRFYKNYYENQIGNGLSVFRGATVQKGHGIGGFFSSLLKGAMPLLKSGVKSIGKELLSTGVGLARDALQGKDMKSAAKQRFMASGDNLLGKLSDTMSGNGFQPMRKRRKTKSGGTRRGKKRRTTCGRSSLFKNVAVSGP